MDLHKQLLKELHLFFYYNQYDEEKYPHFRASDLISEYDYDGIKYDYVVFYD